MSAFTEPLAQVRRFVGMRDASKGRQDALAALDRLEQLAADMEKMVFGHHQSLAAIGGGPCICDICRAVLSAREEGADTP